MRRVAAIGVALALGWWMAGAAPAIAAPAGAASIAAPAGAAPSKPQRATSASCVKRTPLKRTAAADARTAGTQAREGVRRAKARSTRRPVRQRSAWARLHSGRRVLKHRRRACAERGRDSGSARPEQTQPAPDTPTTPVAGVPAPIAGAGPETPADPAPAPLVASTLGVEAHDFGTFVLRLTRTTVPDGNLTIYFRNRDVSEHNLWLDAPDPNAAAERISDDVGENGGATKTVRVTAGAWRLYCSLPGHGSMDRTLDVT